MKTLWLTLLACVLTAFSAGCNHLDLTPPGDADRVVTGVISTRANTRLPSDTEVIVRVVDVSGPAARPNVLGDQTILNPGGMPVPFRIEFHADDTVLRRGVNLEVRVSVGGKLRFASTSAHPLTVNNLNDSHVLEVSVVE